MTDDFDVEAFIEAPLKKPPQPTMAVSGDDAVSSHTSHSHENGHGRSVDGDGDSVMVDARNGENGENGGHEGEGSERRESLKSSRSRDDEASEGRDKDRERSKDGDRDRDRRRSSRSDRDRERRKRSRSRDRHSSSRRRRSRSRSRRRSDRDRERDRHRRRSRSRRRSSSRDRDRKRDRDRRDRSRSRRDRSRDRYGRDRSPKRGEKSKKSRSPSPQLTQEERDRRTVFVMQLAARLRDSELIEFFERAGKVRDVRIVADRASRRSKGVGYVEFREVEAVEKALAMSGEKLLGVPIIVSLSEAEKNRLAEQAARAARQHEIPHNRLYVGSLQFHLTEDDLRQVFEPFGRLESVVINRDPETKQSNGFGFVQFVKPDDAKQALEHMNGYNLAGRQIRVGLVTEKSGTQVDLDDSDVAGFTLTQQSRVELMAKLAKSHGDVFAPQEKPSQPTVIATRNILLKNMFNPAEETEPNWQQEIELDVKEECENKYGKVMHIAVDVIDETEGHVYLKFDTTLSSQKAVTGLNGRWFSGRQIEATFIPDLKYNAKYPDATLL